MKKVGTRPKIKIQPKPFCMITHLAAILFSVKRREADVNFDK